MRNPESGTPEIGEEEGSEMGMQSSGEEEDRNGVMGRLAKGKEDRRIDARFRRLNDRNRINRSPMRATSPHQLALTCQPTRQQLLLASMSPSNVYQTPGRLSTITRWGKGSYSFARDTRSSPYPSIQSITRRGEALIVDDADADKLSDLWLGDAIHVGAISAAGTLNRVAGENRTLTALIERGLFDREEEDARNAFEERAMRYSAVCSTLLLDSLVDMQQWVSRTSGQFLGASADPRTGCRT
jgi:hypothetical protein